MMALWRAVFCLSYVDGALAGEEMGFVTRVMDRFNFSEQQRSLVYADMVERAAPVERFKAIDTEAYRQQFFRLARILIWCDGFLHESEKILIEGFKAGLGPLAQAYQSEMRWLDRKPETPLGIEINEGLAATEAMVAYQMLAFMKELEGSHEAV